MVRDDGTRNGASGGRRRRAPRRRVPGEDDRPRGFEPDRMRRLWNDIDQARDNLGLGPTPPNGTSWSVLGLVSGAAGLAGEAANALTSGAVDALRGALGAMPAPRCLLQGAASCARRLPVIGGLFSE